MADYPMEVLEKYQGKSPKASDYDAYWERALAEVNALPLDYELEKDPDSPDNVYLGHLYFTGTAAARIHCQVLGPKAAFEPEAESTQPTEKKQYPVMFTFHGYESLNGDWFSKLPFAYNDIIVIAMDTRGQAGRSDDLSSYHGSTFQGHIVRGISEESPDRMFFRNVYLDTVQAVRVVSSWECSDAEYFYSVGFSQGGALTIAQSALSQQIRYTIAGYPFLCDFKRVYEYGYSSRSYDEMFQHFKLQDPLHEHEDEFFERLSYIDIQWMAEKLNNPITMITGLKDVICPPSTQFAAYNKISSPKEHVFYKDFGHDNLPYAWDKILFFLLKNIKGEKSGQVFD